MNSLILIEELISRLSLDESSSHLQTIWNTVWVDKSVNSYSQLRIYKTIDKLKNLSNMGVDFYHKKILDIGCGDGSTLRLLNRLYGVTGTGIDISQEVIDHLRFESEEKKEGITYLVGDHRDIKFEQGSFDIVS